MIIGTGYQRYDCTENDNHMHLVTEDGVFDEIWVGDALDKQHTIIGAEDLSSALALLGLEIVRKKKKRKPRAGGTAATAPDCKSGTPHGGSSPPLPIKQHEPDSA